MVPKIELSLMNDNHNTGRLRDYEPTYIEINNKENDNKAMNRMDILMMSKSNRGRKFKPHDVEVNNEQLLTFDSKGNDYQLDTELRPEDLFTNFRMVDKSTECTNDFNEGTARETLEIS